MENMMQIVRQEGIFFQFANLDAKRTNVWGLYFIDRQQPYIVIDETVRNWTPALRSVLAEELGHHFTVPQADILAPYASYHVDVNQSKDETRALRWACNYLIPESDFLEAMSKGLTTRAQLAEYFVVIPSVIQRRIDFMRARLGLGWANYPRTIALEENTRR